MTKEEAEKLLIATLSSEKALIKALEQGKIPFPKFFLDQSVKIPGTDDDFTIVMRSLRMASYDEIDYFLCWLYEVQSTEGCARLLVSDEFIKLNTVE